MGTPPEEDPNANEGASGQRTQVNASASSLASRIDAFMATDDEPESKPATSVPSPVAQEASSRASSEIVDLDDLEEINEPPRPKAIPPRLTPPPIRPPAIPMPPPLPRVVVPPPKIAIPNRSGSQPLPRVPAPIGQPSIAIPPATISVPAPAESADKLAERLADKLAPASETADHLANRLEENLARGKPATMPPPESPDKLADRLAENLTRTRPPTTPPGPPAEKPESSGERQPRATTLAPELLVVDDEPPISRTTTGGAPPVPARAKRSTHPPSDEHGRSRQNSDGAESIGHRSDVATLSAGGVEVSTETANIVVEQPLEAQLESPTVVDKALAQLGDNGGEARAEAMTRELDALPESDTTAAACLAYELGELYERRLADEARAVKAFGRALTLDPSLRPNLWAIRRVFYRRGLWPNLAKLISAEVAYARDDHERADLLLEKARVVGHHVGDLDDAREALDEAVRISPAHQNALLELERVVAKRNDVPALLDVWERLAEAVEHPARKISYWLEVGRAAGTSDHPRAQAAFDRAALLATGGAIAERIARERLRIAEEHGTPADVGAAIESLATLLLGAFGPAGPAVDPGVPQAEGRLDRGTALRRELVALRRRQAQLARSIQGPGEGKGEAAWDTLQQALALSPGEPLVLADLTELAEELGRYDDLAELVQSWQAIEGDPGRAMVLSIRRADALLRGGQREQARALLASLEASAPGFIVLTSAAERDALGRGDLPELARAYLSAAHAALLGSWLGPGQVPTPDPSAAAALYIQAAELLAYEVGGVEAIDEARGALGRALEAIPNHPAALEALTELDDTTGNVAGSLERLRAAAETATGDAKRALQDRAIRLARSHGDLDAVLGFERDTAALAPHDLSISWRIESTLAQLGKDEERAQLLAEIAGRETDATRRGTALLAAARLRERAGAVELATDLYRQVLALWPEDTFARESLIDLLRAQERWTELVTERRNEARALPDGGPARRALREAAWVLEVRLNDVATAAVVYDEWLVRLPDDRLALEGAARCRSRFGDRGGEVRARQAIADVDKGPEAQWLLGRAFERAGQFDEAADVYRALAVREDTSVAATSAAFALADLAAGRADTVMRVEATAALAGRTTDARLGAALAEDSGWMYALVLEDFDRAAQSFEAANALESTRRGALLGAALVAARRGEATQLAKAYGALAAAVDMPEAAAALHLRAAAMASAAGDTELANHRIGAARQAAPDDVSALLVVAETGTLPAIGSGSEDSDESVVGALLARAEILETRAALADDPTAQSSFELDRAEALELAGRVREAARVVVAVLKVHPGDLRALEALRRMAKRAGDLPVWARACYALAKQIGDRPAKLGLLRDAATVFDAPATAQLAMSIFRRILSVDPGAKELDRLLDLLRERADVRGLVAAMTDRLTWLEAEAPAELTPDQAMVPLLLERATVLFGLGDADAAMADLDALLDRAPNNVEALRFRADLAIAAGDAENAVALWRRCLAVETRPQRKTEIELQLSKVLAENVNDVAGAIEQLERVVESTPDDLQLRERLLGLCLRANDYQRATRELGVLAKTRPTAQEKAREELRLGLMLRDKLNDKSKARLAFDRGRGLDPLNLDVVRELVDLLDPGARAQVLASTAASFRAQIGQTPGRAILYERLAQVTGWQSDIEARWLALVGHESLGTPATEHRPVLTQGRSSIAAPTAKGKLDESARGALRGGLTGPLVELWRAIAPAVQVATGVDAGKLGFVRGDRLALKKLGDKNEPLATALTAFGIDDVELYISASRPGVARVIAAETPILCLGADIAAASSAEKRFVLGRIVASLAEGVATVPDLRDVELSWMIVAVLRAIEAKVPAELADAVADDATAVAERVKLLKKELSRKAKGVVTALATQKGAELADVAGFRRHAIAVGMRAGLAWCGDLAVALAILDVGKGGKALVDNPSALDLVGWSVSEEHMKLREKLATSLKVPK